MSKNPPESMQRHLRNRLNAHATARWPQVDSVEVRFRSGFAYVEAQLKDKDGPVPLCSLRFTGVLHTWGFALHLASTGKYEDNFLSSGLPAGSPEDCVTCVGDLYLDTPA
ncbi:hypothetical protein AB0E81_33030 [Streptomyces sp. NPDC033538]|uniref:hypothetical protein n=1 Tax=Streptomyces sp. NPDC033538 TaxID=3155367 RepID=UPI0033F9E627